MSKQLSWGFSYRAAAENTCFFVDEETFICDRGQWLGYIETTGFAGIRSNLFVRNLGARIFYQQSKVSRLTRADAFTGTQAVDREPCIFIRLALSGQF